MYQSYRLAGRLPLSPHKKLLPDSYIETVAKVNSLTILPARLSRLCRKDEAQGAEGEV